MAVAAVGTETTVFTTTVANPAPDPQVIGLTSGDFAMIWSPLGLPYSTAGALFSSTGALLGSVPTGGSNFPTAIGTLSTGDVIAAQTIAMDGQYFIAVVDIPPPYTSASSPVILVQTSDVLSGLAIANGSQLEFSYYDQTTVVLLSANGSAIVATNANTALPTQVAELTGGSSVVEWDSSGGLELSEVSATGTVLQNQLFSQNIAGEIGLAATSGGNLAIAFSSQGAIDFNILNGETFSISYQSVISPSGEAADLSPAIATLANGDFVVAWYNGTTHQIEAQLLSPTGSLLGSPFQVNTNTTNIAPNVSVAALANGNFVVAWATDNGSTATVEDQIFSLTADSVPFPFANNNDITEAVYIGYFGRAGDPAGDAFWLSNLSSGSISTSGMAASFSVQTEATVQYPFLANPSTATQTQVIAFIESIYQDLFNRAADSAGLSYWQNYLTSNLGNPQAVGAFILAVIDGAQGSDQTTITNKVAVADYLTQQFTAAGISFTSAASSANTLAHSAIASVTSVSSTVLAAESTINSYLSTQSSNADVALVGASHTSAVSSLYHI